MRLNDAELRDLMLDIESDRVERKESFNGKAPETVRQAVCAFANDLQVQKSLQDCFYYILPKIYII